MKKSIWAILLAVVFLTIMLSGCARVSTPVPPTNTPSPIPPTSTPEPTATATLKPSPTPTPTPIGDPEFMLKTVCDSNVYDRSINPNLGKIVRFKTPIQINPGGDILVIKSIENIEKYTNNLVTFEIVDQDPPVGIIVVEGDAINQDGSPGPGNVTTERDTRGSTLFNVGNDGYITSQVYLHLSSPGWNYRDIKGVRSNTSIIEHELAHALGLGHHFEDFSGNEGFSYNVIIATIALYRIPSGTDMVNACSSLDPTCPTGTGPGGITAGSYDPVSIDDNQRLWLWEIYGHDGYPNPSYGGERCRGGTP